MRGQRSTPSSRRKPRPDHGTAICQHCGIEFVIKNPYARNRFHDNACRYAALRGPDAPFWRGGTPTIGAGYVRQWAPDHPFADAQGYVYQHRLVAEQMIGRLLEPDEEVHHIDLCRSNNDPSNLMVVTAKEHSRLHSFAVTGQWAKLHDCCVACGTTEQRHVGRGLCTVCYERNRKRHRKAA